MSQAEAAEALGEGQLLKQRRKVKQALKEAKMNAKDKTLENSRKSSTMHGNQLPVERLSGRRLWDKRREILPNT